MTEKRDSLSQLPELLQMLDLHSVYSQDGFDPWYTLVDIPKEMVEFQAEVAELAHELERGDDAEISKELGDVFWDLLSTLRKLEDAGKVDRKQVFATIYEKMSRRKPYLLTGEKVTKEQAIQMWNEAKRSEGYSEDRLWTPEREELHTT